MDFLEHVVRVFPLVHRRGIELDPADLKACAAARDGGNLKSFGLECDDLVVVQVNHIAGVSHDRANITRQKMFVLAYSQDERASAPCADDDAGDIRMHDRDAIGPDNLTQSTANGLDQRAFVLRGRLFKRLTNEMGQDLCIGLGVEFMPPFDELLAKSLVVFNDAIVHEVKTPRTVRVGVGVFAGHRAMSRPAGVADADLTRNGIFFDLFSQIGNASNGFSDIDTPRLKQSHTGRVVSAIFQAAQTVQENRKSVRGSYVSNNSAHKSNVTKGKVSRKD